MQELLKKYIEIAKLALLQEKAQADSPLKGMNEHEKEFLPAVLEVTETPPSHAARLLSYVIMSVFVITLLWAVFGKIDIIATAAGKLMPAANIKTIQTLTDSEIEEIYVVEGQYVKEGQELIKFNQTEVTANINRIKNEMKALEIAVARLQALLTDNPEANFNYDENIDEYLVKMHKNLLTSQVNEKKAQIEVLNGQIAMALKEKDTIGADLARIERLLPSVEERIEKKRVLVEKNLLARLTFLEQEEELINLQEQRNVQTKKMAQNEENIEFLKKELRQYLAEYDKNIIQELTQNREQLASYQQELIKYEEALKRTIVKAPLAGYVQQLVYHTKGGVVEGAKPIMNIVPEDYMLEADVKILNKDIGFVRAAQEVEIKIDSFPFTKAWTGMTTKEYKQLKGLKKENLRDNMTNMELVLNMLAEVSATEISQSQNPKGLAQHKKVARAGGEVANKARKELESQTGKKVVTDKNAKKLHKQIEVLEKK